MSQKLLGTLSFFFLPIYCILVIYQHFIIIYLFELNFYVIASSYSVITSYCLYSLCFRLFLRYHQKSNPLSNSQSMTDQRIDVDVSDHDMVTATCALKPSVQKQKPRKVTLLSKADWPKFKSLTRDYQQKFLLNHFDRTVEELWSDFVSAIDNAASKCIPTKTIQSKSSLPWIT